MSITTNGRADVLGDTYNMFEFTLCSKYDLSSHTSPEYLQELLDAEDDAW